MQYFSLESPVFKFNDHAILNGAAGCQQDFKLTIEGRE